MAQMFCFHVASLSERKWLRLATEQNRKFNKLGIGEKTTKQQWRVYFRLKTISFSRLCNFIQIMQIDHWLELQLEAGKSKYSWRNWDMRFCWEWANASEKSNWNFKVTRRWRYLRRCNEQLWRLNSMQWLKRG